jgi:hypothetical protein
MTTKKTMDSWFNPKFDTHPPSVERSLHRIELLKELIRDMQRGWGPDMPSAASVAHDGLKAKLVEEQKQLIVMRRPRAPLVLPPKATSRKR